jgi:hypothetical protein
MNRDRSVTEGPPPAPVEVDAASIAPPWTPEDGPQPLVQYSAEVMPESVGPRHAGYVLVTVDAGPRPCERVVPPAGEAHAFDAARWARRVEVVVSPTGRSARVWVDGVEIPAETSAAAIQVPEDPEPPAGPETGVQGPVRGR